MMIEFGTNNRAPMPVLRGKYVDRIRMRDAAGRLTAAGAEWIEPDVVKTIGCILGAMPFMGLAILGVVQAGSAIEAWLSGLPFLAVGVALVAVALSAKQNRALLFHDDGRITIPFGLTGWGRRTEMQGSHEHVASIEAEVVPPNEMADQEKGAHVIIFSRGGDTIYIAGPRLRVETARKIAVQLSHALKEVRDFVAGPAEAGPAGSHGLTVLID